MATTPVYDLTAKQTGRGGNAPSPFMVDEIIVDFTVNPLGAATTAKVAVIPAQTLVLGAVLKCLVAEGSALTMSVGDSSSDTEWFTTASINALTHTSADTVKYYATADFVTITTSAAGAKAQALIKLIMVGLDDLAQYIASKQVTG